MKFVCAGNLGLEGEYPQLEVWGRLNSCNKLGTEQLACYRVEQSTKVFPGYSTALTSKEGVLKTSGLGYRHSTSVSFSTATSGVAMFSSQQMTIKKEKQKVYNLSQILLFKGKRSYHNATIASYDLLTSDPDAQIAIMR